MSIVHRAFIYLSNLQRTNHPWIAAFVVVAFGALYFRLLPTNEQTKLVSDSLLKMMGGCAAMCAASINPSYSLLAIASATVMFAIVFIDLNKARISGLIP